MGDIKEGSSPCQAGGQTSHKASQRWSILRNAIVKKAQTRTEGSIHQFPGFGLLRRQRLPRNRVAFLQNRLTTIRVEDGDCNALVERLELSLLALTALRPAQWVWEFAMEFSSPEDAVKLQSDESETSKLLANLEERLTTTTAEDPKQRLRLGDGSGWLFSTKEGNNNSNSACLKIVLKPFVPSQGIFQYILPSFSAEGELIVEEEESENEGILVTRERLSIAAASLRELTSHHRNKGVDNTGNICVWDSEQTMTFGLLKMIRKHPWWPSPDESSCLDILELGAGMAGLAGFALAQKLQKQGLPFRLWLTDGHPQAIHNNKVNAHMMNFCSNSQRTNAAVQCSVLPWFVDPPPTNQHTQQCPPPCSVAIVSDCTHFQEFHAHLFFTLAYSLKVGGYAYLCQPHRGKSLQRFLDLVQLILSTGDPIFAIQWLEIPELVEAGKKAEQQQHHYNPDIHYPHWVLLHKLREVQKRDHCLLMDHMRTRDS